MGRLRSAPADAVCTVRWSSLDPAGIDLLSDRELVRLNRFRTDGDRQRFITSTAVLRQLVAAETGSAASEVVVDRRCATCGRQHGRPVLPHHRELFVSITHSGPVVGVAITRAGPVGLDVELPGVRDERALRDALLGSTEFAGTPSELLRTWTRKESLVKATGDGIAIGLPDVVVTPPDRPPRLVGYPGRPGLHACMTDLACRPGCVAAASVLTDAAVSFDEQWH